MTNSIKITIAKNGAKMYYVDGKRISREKAIEISKNADVDMLTNALGANVELKDAQAILVIATKDPLEAGKDREFGWCFTNVTDAVEAAKKVAALFGDRFIKARIVGDATFDNKVIATVDAAGNVEIKKQTPEYIFTAYQVITGVDCNGRTEHVESFATTCKELGDDDNFTGLYREVTFYEDWHYNAWDIKTADGKLIAKGNTEAELKKAYETIKAGNVEISEETADDVKDVFDNEINTINEEIKIIDTFNKKISKLIADNADKEVLIATVKEFDAAYKEIGDKRNETCKALRDLNIDDTLYTDYFNKRGDLMDELCEHFFKSVKAKEQVFKIILIGALVDRLHKTDSNAGEVSEEIAEINAADVKINVTDNGKIIEQIKVSVDTAINIINRLNYRNNSFVYRHTTRYDNADIQCRHFDAYKANGEKDAFAITEYVIGGKLEIVRFFNHFRNIIVDLQIGNVNYTLGDKGEIVLTAAEEIADITDVETAEVIPVERFWCEVEIAGLSEQDAADIVAHFHGQDGANKFFKMRATELDGTEEDIGDDNPFDLLPTLDELPDVDIAEDAPEVNPAEYAITQEAMDEAIKAEEYNAYVADITEQILSDPVTDAAYRAAKERVEVTFTAKGNIGHLTYIKKNGERSNDERVAWGYITKCGLSHTEFIVKAKHDLPADNPVEEIADKPVLLDWDDSAIAHPTDEEELAEFNSPPEIPAGKLDEMPDIAAELVAGEKIYMGNRTCTYNVNGEKIHFDKGEWFLIESDKYGVKLCRDEGVVTWDISNIDGRRLKVDCTEAEFWRAMIKRGACTIDLTDAEMLTATLKEVTRKARLMDIYPQNGRRIVDNLYKVEIAPDGGGFIFTNGYEALARYDNREQCQDVIERIKRAIDDCDTEFEFPTAKLVDLEKKLPALMIEQFNKYRYRSKGRSIPRRLLAAQLKYYGLTASDLRKYKTA